MLAESTRPRVIFETGLPPLWYFSAEAAPGWWRFSPHLGRCGRARLGSVRRRRPDELTLFTGQTAGLVHDVLPAAETVREIVDAANNPIGRSDPLGLRPVTDSARCGENLHHPGAASAEKYQSGGSRSQR